MNRRAPGGRSGLVRMRDDGRIEQRGGFQRVFGQKIGADQQLSLFGEVVTGRHQLADLFKAFQERVCGWC